MGRSKNRISWTCPCKTSGRKVVFSKEPNSPQLPRTHRLVHRERQAVLVHAPLAAGGRVGGAERTDEATQRHRAAHRCPSPRSLRASKPVASPPDGLGACPACSRTPQCHHDLLAVPRNCAFRGGGWTRCCRSRNHCTNERFEWGGGAVASENRPSHLRLKARPKGPQKLQAKALARQYAQKTPAEGSNYATENISPMEPLW